MERSGQRTPIIQRSKGACTIGLVITLGFAIFGVGGAAAGDGSYARHVHEQKLAGIALAHRTPEQFLLAMKPRGIHAATGAQSATSNPTPAVSASHPAPPPPPPPAPTTPAPAAATPAPAVTTAQPAPSTPAPAEQTAQPATTTTQPTTTATQPATTTTTTQPTTTPLPTTTTPAPASPTPAVTPTGPDNNGNNGNNGNGNGNDSTVTPALQISSASSSGECYGRCTDSSQSPGVLPAALPSTSSQSAPSLNLTTSSISDNSSSSTVAPAVAIVSVPALPPVSSPPAPAPVFTPPVSTAPPAINLTFPTRPSGLLQVTHGNGSRPSTGTAPIAIAGTGAATAGGTTIGGAIAPAAGTLIASAPVAGATAATGATATAGATATTHGAGRPGSTEAHPKAKKHVFSGVGSIFTAPVDTFVQPFHFIGVIPTWIKLALGAAVALALAFAAIALRSTRRASKLAAISADARTDPLTRILNRRGFMEAADRELARASRYGRPFVLAYVDVRWLKTVNDTEGHLTGDQLLKSVAGLMKESARADDIVGRIGGDEFALLLAEQTAEGAAPVLRRINTRVEEHRSAMEIRVPWELTIGVAAFPEDGATLEDLIGVADRRLYEQRGIALR